MKLYNINLSKTEYIDLLTLVNFYDFCLAKTVTSYFDLPGHFRDVERLCPPKSVRLSNSKGSFRLENMKIIKKLLVPEYHNFYVKLRNL